MEGKCQLTTDKRFLTNQGLKDEEEMWGIKLKCSRNQSLESFVLYDTIWVQHQKIVLVLEFQSHKKPHNE